MRVSRRGVLTASIASLGAGAAEGMIMDPFTVSAAQADLERYVGFGVKASGGPGDRAAGAWLEAELRALGFAIERQTFEAPWFEPSIAEIAVDGQVAAVIPQAVVVTTPQDGISAPLVLADAGDRARLKGAIAIVSLPHARWSSLVSPVPRQMAQAAFDAGAAAVVLITHGPTGQALALNAPADGPMFPRPAAILAPKAAPPFLAAAARGEVGRLTVAGAGGRREAYNIVARLDRGRGRWLVVSTPRSGWFGCAGERGPGVAIWLMLARWAARADLPVNVAFVCNSGHEYENLGAARLLHDAAPKPAQTAFWLHLGANAAARDWHELGGQMTPLPSADPQRYLGVSPSLIDEARRIFAGQPGLEAPYPAAPGAAGELGHIIAAGYPALAGVFGAHRFHHAADDDLRTVEPAHAVQAAIGFRDLIQSALKSL